MTRKLADKLSEIAKRAAGFAFVLFAVLANSSNIYCSRGEFFRKELSVSNNSYPSVQVEVTDGVNVSPTESGNLFIPPATEAYTYDEDGNLKTDGRWSYTWDAENRLTKMESLANPPSGSARRLEFKYDWCGRRIYKKETDLGTSQVLSEHIYVYDGWNLYAELTASGTLVQTYIWGQDLSGSRQGAGGVGGLVGVKPAGGAVHFAAYDGGGNVAGLVDGSSGLISAWYEYGPFGEAIRVSGPMAKANPIRFSSKYTDDTSQFVCYAARYYNPAQGRWLSRDPLGESGGLNLYGFVGNNPVNSFDPLGYECGDLLDPNTYLHRAKGFAEGSWDQVTGLANTLWHPQDTVDNLVDAAYNYDQTLDAIKQAVADQVQRYMKSKKGCIDPCIALEMEGKIASELASLALGMGALGDAGKLGELAELAKVKTAEKLGSVAKAAKTPLTSGVGDLRAAGVKDAHHVIQDAAVRDLPDYNTQLAPGVQLSGPSTEVGSPHYIATQVQRQAGGGTLAAEMRIGYKALRQAGYSETQARQIIGETDAYFRSIGATPSTPTRIPGNR